MNFGIKILISWISLEIMFIYLQLRGLIKADATTIEGIMMMSFTGLIIGVALAKEKK